MLRNDSDTPVLTTFLKCHRVFGFLSCSSKEFKTPHALLVLVLMTGYFGIRFFKIDISAVVSTLACSLLNKISAGFGL